MFVLIAKFKKNAINGLLLSKLYCRHDYFKIMVIFLFSRIYYTVSLLYLTTLYHFTPPHKPAQYFAHVICFKYKQTHHYQMTEILEIICIWARDLIYCQYCQLCPLSATKCLIKC